MVWYGTCFWILRSLVKNSANHFPSLSSKILNRSKALFTEYDKALLYICKFKSKPVNWNFYACLPEDYKASVNKKTPAETFQLKISMLKN
jgi:hypothetical protein